MAGRTSLRRNPTRFHFQLVYWEGIVLQNKQVAVIGTVFVDCKGFAADSYVPQGRNLGAVRFVHGGVGRNVAENMALLGLPVSLVSSVDRTALGSEVRRRLQDSGVDTSCLVDMDGRGMGMWLAVLDGRGELAGSISQMPDLTGMRGSIDQDGTNIMNKSSHVALELDLDEYITTQSLRLAKDMDRPVFGLPGNLDIVLRRPDVLDGLECFICNHVEIGRLVDRDFESTDINAILDLLPNWTRRHGLRSAVVTLGPDGAVYFEARTGNSGHEPACRVDVTDTCGAGDAFFSGCVYGQIQGWGLPESVRYGTRAAACTIQSSENNCCELQSAIARLDVL